MRTLRNVNNVCIFIYLDVRMSRLGMLISVTARAVLSIERGGQFCGPRCIRGALRCADHRRRPSDPCGS